VPCVKFKPVHKYPEPATQIASGGNMVVVATDEVGVIVLEMVLVALTLFGKVDAMVNKNTIPKIAAIPIIAKTYFIGLGLLLFVELAFMLDCGAVGIASAGSFSMLSI
jgi:hypothetical protein